MTYNLRARLLLGSCAPIATALMPTAAHAQVAEQVTEPADVTKPDAEAPADEQASAAEGESEPIVVTGTLIRGIAPIGTNVVSLSREDIVATGAMNANDILAKIPQVTTAFLSTPTVSANDQGSPAFSPNIRDLGRASGSTTLVLIDGHRAGDADAVPPGVLERVEVMPDGGSSIYGSDAIGGVINYITRKRVDGFEVIARHGFAEDYNTTDINLTGGKVWDSGSAYLSYSFQKNDAILGRDRDFMQQISANQGYCAPGTIFANGTSYALPGRTPGTITDCDITDEVSYWPAVKRNTVFAAFTQDLTDSISFDVRGHYMRRETTSFYGMASALPQTLTVPGTNAFFQPIAGETSQTVLTSFDGVYDDRAFINIDEFRITPTLTAQIGSAWQLRVMANYRKGETDSRSTQVDGAAINAALASSDPATALNPYDLGDSSQAVLASIARTRLVFSKYLYKNARAIAEGPLFHFGGGDVRLAVGAEYQREKQTDIKNGLAIPGQEDSLPNTIPDFSRTIKSVFGEIAAPIFGPENAKPGIHSLTLSASARYDHYSDVGGTFNPKFGVNYEPVDWVRVRGNWGTSFNAPVAVQRSAIQAAGGLPVPLVPGQQAPWTLILAGFAPDVGPQTADTWSLGIDVRPPVIPGLNVSTTYYNIFLKDQIGLLGFGQLAFSPELADFVQDNQTCADLIPRYGSINFPFQIPLSTICALNPQPTMAVVDLRQQNLGQLKQDGIDFNVTYDRQVSFGAINAGFAGSYLLSRKSALVAGAEFADELKGAGTSRFFFVASVGAQVGNLTASAALNHRHGYDLTPDVSSTRFPTQSRVKSFNTVDLFLNYKLPSAWLNDETYLTLNVNNLLNEDPPFYNGCIGTALCGFINGSTLGRLTTLGLRTKF